MVSLAPVTPQAQSRTPRIERLLLNGQPLVVNVWEPPVPSNRTPVLLIHGWGGAGSYWHSTARALSETTHVYVPDLPGTGRSQPVTTAQNMFAQVRHLAGLLDHFELNEVQVVGHSMGGAMGILLAKKRPQQVERLVLTSLCFFLNRQQEQVYKAIMKGFFATMPFRATWMADLPGLPTAMATRYFYRVPKDRDLLRNGLLEYLSLDGATARACADNACDPSIPEAGSQLDMPVLLVACRQDQVMPVENVEFTLSKIPNSDVRWIDNCGHVPMLEKADEYLAILGDFLEL